MDNLIIMNTIIENQRAQKHNTYMFFADAVKCFNKLWLKDCLLEMYDKANISESQRGIFLVNMVSNVYELVKITQNDKITAKCQKCKQLEGKKGEQWII